MTLVHRPRNWAGNITYRAEEIHHPSSISEIQELVERSSRIRALGSMHSFNDLADSPASLVSLADFPSVVEVDADAATAYVTAGTRYAELARHIDREGFALPTLASLPHISIGGACSTATHGSGVRNGVLATAVSQVEMVTAEGDVVTVGRDDESFNGTVVSLGALGVVVSLTLDLVPSFEVCQRVYEGLPMEVLDDHFDELMSSAHSVCIFTDWRGPWLTQVWVQRRVGDPEPEVVESPWFTAAPADGPRHPAPGMSPDSCTEQAGVAGRWFERLPHFRPEFTPSSGEELQSEYMISRRDVVPALHALDRIRERIHPVLQISEFRTVAADELWLSPCYRQDSVSIHFTWIADAETVLPVVSLVEEALAPFHAKPHWAKVFTTPPSGYERLPDFRELMGRYDPTGKFTNDFIDRYILEDR